MKNKIILAIAFICALCGKKTIKKPQIFFCIIKYYVYICGYKKAYI
jgi:hypothetical protein